jgi:hypothetical protein
MNLRCGRDEQAVQNYSIDTEDQQIIQRLLNEVTVRDKQLTELRQLIEIYEQAFEASAAQLTD